jgi:hypothetical protein
MTGLWNLLKHHERVKEISVLHTETLTTSKRKSKKYCEILITVIIQAKKLHYNQQIKTSSNKVKTLWKITKDLHIGGIL